MNFKQNARKACYFHRSILKNYFIRVPLQIKLYLIYTNIPWFYIVSLDNPDSTTNRRVWMKSSKSLDEVFIKMISLEDVVTHKKFFFHYLRSTSSFCLVRWWMTWIIFGVVIAISYRPINFGKPRMGQNVLLTFGPDVIVVLLRHGFWIIETITLYATTWTRPQPATPTLLLQKKKKRIKKKRK